MARGWPRAAVLRWRAFVNGTYARTHASNTRTDSKAPESGAMRRVSSGAGARRILTRNSFERPTQ